MSELHRLELICITILISTFCLGWSLASIYWNKKFAKQWDWAIEKSKEFDERLKNILEKYK
jgi:hypothetical protein